MLRASDFSVVATVAAGDQPSAVALTPAGAFAYVANLTTGDVTVIDTSDHSVVETIGVGTSPVFVAVAALSTASPTEEVACLEEVIDELEAAGSINSGQARALRNHLESALRSIELGNTAAARAQLEAFIQQVQQLVADGVLTAAEAAPLIAGAHRLLAAL